MIWLLIGYMWLFIHRPFEVWPILGDMRSELLYVIVTSIAWAATSGKRLTPNVLHVAIVAFALAAFASSVISPWADESFLHFYDYSKFLFFYLLLVSIVHEEKQLKLVLLSYLVCMGLYMLHSLWEFHNGRYVSRMGIIRMTGVDSSYSDPNAFSGSIVLALVFVPVVWSAYSARLVRLYLLGFLGLSMICILQTGSRAAFVGMGLWGAFAIARSRYRWIMAIVAVVCLPLIWSALPAALQTRFETIVNPDVGPKNAKLSADVRMDGLRIGWELWDQYPLSGIGPGVWCAATGRKLQSHCLYGQLPGELGTLGMVTFAGILLACAVNLRRVSRTCREYPVEGPDFLRQLNGSIGVALLLLLLFGYAGHNLFRYQWVWFAAFLTIVHHCVAQRVATTAPCPEPLPWAPPPLSVRRQGLNTA